MSNLFYRFFIFTRELLICIILQVHFRTRRFLACLLHSILSFLIPEEQEQAFFNEINQQAERRRDKLRKPAKQESNSRTNNEGKIHRVHIEVEQKEVGCICPLSWSVHHNLVLYVMVDLVKGAGRASAGASFSIMMECTPESGRRHSIYSRI
jgi:hypothetical protein